MANKNWLYFMMSELLAVALSSVVFFTSPAAAENDVCLTTLGKVPVSIPAGTNQERLDACVQWLFQKVKAGSQGKIIGKYRPGVELIKWQSGREWTYGQCYLHKGEILFTLFSTSPAASKPSEQNKACLAQDPIWTMLGGVDLIVQD